MCVFMYSCIGLCVPMCLKELFFFCVLALLLVLTLPLGQKHLPSVVLHSSVCVYPSTALHQLSPPRSVSQPPRPRGLRWLPQWAAAPACPAASTDRWRMRALLRSYQHNKEETKCKVLFFHLRSSRTTSRSSCKGASLVGASLMGATPHACPRAAAWGSSASLMSSCPPWSRTVVSVPETPAVRRSVRLRRKTDRLVWKASSKTVFSIFLCNPDCANFNHFYFMK